MIKEDETTVAGEMQQLLIESGFPHPLTLENRFQAMMSLCLHSVVLSHKANKVSSGAKPPTGNDLLSLIDYENVDDEIKHHFICYVHSEG